MCKYGSELKFYSSKRTRFSFLFVKLSNLKSGNLGSHHNLEQTRINDKDISNGSSLIPSPVPETAPAPVGQTVVGLVAGTGLTVLLLVCSIAGMILQKWSRNRSNTQTETAQCPVPVRGETEYMQMERQARVQDRTETGRTGGRQETVPASETYGGEYSGRDTMSDGGGGDQVISTGRDYSLIHGAEHGVIHQDTEHGIIHQVTEHGMIHQDTDHGMIHIPIHGTHGTVIEHDSDDGWSAYGQQDTRVLLPTRQGYSHLPQTRTNIKLNPIFE